MTTTSYTYTFEAGKSYHVWVHAANDCNQYSGAVHAYFKTTLPAPTGLTATCSSDNKNVTLNWGAVANSAGRYNVVVAYSPYGAAQTRNAVVATSPTLSTYTYWDSPGYESVQYKATVKAIDTGENDYTPAGAAATVTFSCPYVATPIIVFSSTRDGNSEIYKMNADGTGQTRLTTNTVADTHPSIKKDHSQIVYSSNGVLSYLTFSGSASTVSTVTTAAAVKDLTYSFDDTKIAFTMNNNIYVANANGSSITQKTSSGETFSQPTFSHDGTKILFAQDNTASTVMSYSSIRELSLSGTTMVTLTGCAYSMGGDPFGPTCPKYGHPSYSADGSTFIYDVSSAYMYTQPSIEYATSTPLVLATNNNSPSYSGDGTKIVYVVAGDIYIANANGTSPVRLTTTGNNADPEMR